jgi:4'-phosphopantetheinyl transferase
MRRLILQPSGAWSGGSAPEGVEVEKSDPSALEVWRIDLRADAELPPGMPALSALRTLLDEGELKRADRYLVEAPARQFIRTRAALRRLLALRLGEDPRVLQFEVGKHGKPRLQDGRLAFNVSHSGDYALIVVGPPQWGEDLGVDLEWMKPTRRLLGLAQRFFAPPEAKAFARVDASAREELFYRLWTLKEAYLKSCGTGLTFSSRRFAFALPHGLPATSEQGGPRLDFTEVPGDRPDRWWFAEFLPTPGYCAALSVPARESGTVKVRLHDLRELE